MCLGVSISVEVEHSDINESFLKILFVIGEFLIVLSCPFFVKALLELSPKIIFCFSNVSDFI